MGTSLGTQTATAGRLGYNTLEGVSWKWVGALWVWAQTFLLDHLFPSFSIKRGFSTHISERQQEEKWLDHETVLFGYSGSQAGLGEILEPGAQKDTCRRGVSRVQRDFPISDGCLIGVSGGKPQA